MSNTNDQTKEIALEGIITTSVQIPGVKVSRDKFLAEMFATEDVVLQDVLDLGPIQAGVSRDKLSLIANKLILKRTSQSSAASFVAGIPGGLAMAATIPADVMQFFGMALRLAQELSYLYGADDLWQNGTVDEEKIKSQLIMYCGVMFGVSGAVSGVRVLSTQIAKTTLHKLPQKALTKTFWYPIIKQIGKAVGIKVTKSSVAKGISKAIPVIGGVISGTLNFASMMPMANRLFETLDKATFDYTADEMEADIIEIENITEDGELTDDAESKINVSKISDSVTKGIKNVGAGITNLFSKQEAKKEKDDNLEQIKKLKELLDLGAITQEEFDAKKKELLGL